MAWVKTKLPNFYCLHKQSTLQKGTKKKLTNKRWNYQHFVIFFRMFTDPGFILLQNSSEALMSSETELKRVSECPEKDYPNNRNGVHLQLLVFLLIAKQCRSPSQCLPQKVTKTVELSTKTRVIEGEYHSYQILFIVRRLKMHSQERNVSSLCIMNRF